MCQPEEFPQGCAILALNQASKIHVAANQHPDLMHSQPSLVKLGQNSGIPDAGHLHSG